MPLRLPRAPLAAAVLAGVGLVLAIDLGRGSEYWDYSEGVYVLTGHLVLRGGDLYGSIVGAQPPGVYLAGAGLLAIHDGLLWVRAAVGLVQLATGGLAAVLAWRLTGSRLALLAAPLALVTPWALHEHGGLTPEPFGALLVTAAAVAAASDRPVPAGVLGGVAVAFKLPFALPAVLVLLASRAPRRALTACAATAALLGVAALAVFGSGLWHDAVVAQLHSGRLGLHGLLGTWAQAAWSVGGLVLAAAAGLLLRARVRDAAALRVAVALAAGWLLTVLTNYKRGTGLNILVPVETGLLPLAVAGLAWTWQARRLRLLAAGGLAFALAQSAALLAAPERTVAPFLYPTSERGSWGRVADGREVAAAARAARACPAGVPYGGPPLIAFVAGRPMPAGQPDGFLPRISPTLKDVGALIAATSMTCPQGVDAFLGPAAPEQP